jgi:hypothetical protein
VSRTRTIRGSIFGEALHSRHVGDFWGQTLSVSPPTSGRLDPSNPLDDLSPMDEDGDEMLLGEPFSKLKALESAVHTFAYSMDEMASCAYMYFERPNTSVTVSTGKDGPRLNREPVLPRMVNIDALYWKPMLTNQGEEGHSYGLVHDGEHVASIEVTAARVVVVHQTYSPAALEAGLVDPATRLVFDRSHPQQLAGLVDDVMLDSDMLYLPVGELLLGRAFERIPLRVDAKEHPLSRDARRVWMETRTFLRSMQHDVIRGIRNHNSLEFARCGVCAGEVADTDISILR